MAQFIYVMRNVRKAHGDKVVLDNVTLAFLPGAKIGVVGPNGAGKSPVLHIMAGLDQPSNGEATLMPGHTVGLLAQEPRLDAAKDVRGNVEDGVREIRDALHRYEEIGEKLAVAEGDEMQSLLDEMGVLQEKLDHTGAWELDSRLEQAMDALRLPPGDADVTTLSGGERRRVALCQLLLQQPDLLLLDEPTNHLDAESVAWLERHLQNYKGTVVAVTHDRYFLDNVTGWILELDRGRGIPYEGNYSSWLEQKQQRLAEEEKKDSAHQRTIQRELEWVRLNPGARRSKPKARLKNYESLVAEAGSAKLDRQQIHIPAGQRLGGVVVEADGLGKAFGEKLLFEDLSFSLPPGGIVGVIGPNGAGKTTLFRMITVQEQPDAS